MILKKVTVCQGSQMGIDESGEGKSQGMQLWVMFRVARVTF
jgi:hypothetical protein